MKKATKQSTITFMLSMVTIAIILITLLCVFLMVKSNSTLKENNEDRYYLTYNANRFMNASHYLTDEIRNYVITKDKTHYDNYWNEINNLKNREIGVETMNEVGITPEEKSMIEEMSSISNNLVPLEESAMDFLAEGDQLAAISKVYSKEYIRGITNIEKIKGQFLESIEDRTSLEVAKAQKMVLILEIITVVCVIIVIIIQIFTTLTIRKKIIAPIVAIQYEMVQLAKGNISNTFELEPDTSEIGTLIACIIKTKATLKTYIEDIAEKLELLAVGDMRIKVDLDYVGDFEPIKKSMEDITVSLNKTLSLINQSAIEVAMGSGQVADGAQELSQGAQQQASSVEELAATINEIAELVHENDSNAEKANGAAQAAANELAESNQEMQKMTDAMGEIRKSSNQIGNIIKTIEDIAFQTNILALNAAVEAARAGQAGKGFAVVADEVRNLAGKSAEASKNTAELIETSIKAVENGTRIADETAKSIERVVADAQEVSELISKISESSSKQSVAITQVTIGTDQIAAVVQTNSATAEESAAASEELSAQANILKEMMEKFKLKKDSEFVSLSSFDSGATEFRGKPNMPALPKVKEVKKEKPKKVYNFDNEKFVTKTIESSVDFSLSGIEKTYSNESAKDYKANKFSSAGSDKY